MKLRNIILWFACSAGILFSPSAAFAALDLISFHTNPETPSPNQDITVSLQSYAVDLNSAKVTWYVDKVVTKDGVGEKTLQTRTKEFGQVVTIDVVILMPDGARYDKQLLLKPAEVDLLWEADTSVPPFYKGKALPTYKSIVKLSAIPRFGMSWVDPSLYSYAWTANQTQGLAKSAGKNSALLSMKYSGGTIPVSVRVTESSPRGVSAVATKNITAGDPELVFYEDAALLGIRFENVLSGIQETNGTSFAIHAVPYFFSSDDVTNADLSYAWNKDGVTLLPGLDPNTLVLGKEGRSAQSSTVRLSLQNKKRILQAANAEITISFAQE